MSLHDEHVESVVDALMAAGRGEEPPPLGLTREPRWLDYMTLAELAEADRNPKRHDDDAIARSINRFGWIEPIVLDERTRKLIAGHGRRAYIAAAADNPDATPPDGVMERNGVWYVPVFRGWASNSDEEAHAAGVAINQTTIAGGFDTEDLADLLSSFEDDTLVLDAGFDHTDLDALLGGLGDDPEPGLSDGEPGPGRAEGALSLAERFGIPPFTVLDARQGYWQKRKAAWITLGIASELGRTARTYAKTGDADEVTQKLLAVSGGQSIFDPVLCELVYRWFTPPGGSVLDPFAGGSVRGVVAAMLGRDYTGIDLRPEQIVENVGQWEALTADTAATDTVPIKVSAASARQRFAGCSPEYIATTCHAACCRSSTSDTGTVVTIHPNERAAIEARGGRVKGNMLQPAAGERQCPFQDKGTHLCGLHGTDDKPFGCVASPFTLTPNRGTLIVRNRYRRLKCYEDGDRIPAYIAFRSSLELLFGAEQAQRLHDHLEAGGGDIVLDMPVSAWTTLIDNDDIKKGRGLTEHTRPGPTGTAPRWITGNSADLDEHLDDDELYDLVFSCPPYHDLEHYSEDPADLSNMEWGEFMATYRRIIAASVARLRADRWAVWVIGDVRDPKTGMMRNLVSETIAAFEDAGATLYNEAVLLTMASTAALRAARQFENSRKLCKTHQNVLVFYKGHDPIAATRDVLGDVEFGPLSDDGDTEDVLGPVPE